MAAWLASLGAVLPLSGWLGTAADTGKSRSQVMLRKFPEPAPSRALLGGGGGCERVLVLRRETRCSPCGQSDKHLKAKSHQGLLLLLAFGERSLSLFPLDSQVSRGGSWPVWSMGACFSLFRDGSAVLLTISLCNFQVDFLP